MRNLTFIASADVSNQAARFRRAFMDKTAVWNVVIQECESIEEARQVLEGRDHAFVVAPAFRSLLFETATAKGASTKLTQGSDIRYRGGSNTITVSQLARSVIDCLEEMFIPLYGAKVVILGSGSAALDMAYECSRAGVDLISLLDADRNRAQENLDTFLENYAKNKMAILDTEQSRTGHLSATRAYEHCSFKFGSLQALSSIEEADVIISFLSSSTVIPDYSSLLRSAQIVCDPWGRSQQLLQYASAKECDCVTYKSIMDYWGKECAELLIEFGNAGIA